jgi:di/tricarboxylate transporter
LMATVAGLGSVMSSTGVVAIFIPVVLNIADRRGIPPRRLMMPLAFAGLISGMQTLVATPPNMVIDSALRETGQPGFGFFSFTPMGLIILTLGVGYLLFARRWLGSRSATIKPESSQRKLTDYIREYQLDGRTFRVFVKPGSPLLGIPLEELKPRQTHSVNVIGIERQRRFGKDMLHPHPRTELRPNDVLLVDLPTPLSEAQQLAYASMGLDALPLGGSYFSDQTHEVGMAEVLLPPASSLLEKNLIELGFRSKYGLHVIGLRRGIAVLPGNYLQEKLKAGDTLLVAGPWKTIRSLQSRTRDFIVLSLPAEMDQLAPALRQAPFAIGCLLLMVGLMVSGAVPNVVAALIGCLLMGLFRCIDMESAYRSIHWPSLILIVGMMPFSLALQKTGGIELAADGLLQLFGHSGPRVILGGLFALTAVLGMFISNTATAVLMAPVALTVARHLEVSPYPFAMVVAIAASAAFMTPVSSPVNTLVLGPGQYRFVDFVKIGVPFTVLVMIASVVMVPWLFPL